MKRKTILLAAKIAGFHLDTETFDVLRKTRDHSSVKYGQLKGAWFDGVRAKRDGERCECAKCNSDSHGA